MFRKSLRVEHQFVTAYSAWANGVVERANRELVRTLRGLLAETNQRPEMWHTVAPLAQAIINNTPSHSRLNGLTPHEVMFGSPATQPLDTVLGEHIQAREQKTLFNLKHQLLSAAIAIS